MQVRSYYRRWLATAFLHSIGPIDLWAGLAGAGLAAVDHFMPERQLVSALAWQAPLWAALAVVIFRIIAAPFWMAKEDAEKIAQLAANLASNRKRIAIKNRLGEFIEATKPFYGDTPPGREEAVQWRDGARDYIAKAFGEGEAALFLSDSGYPVLGSSTKGDMRNFINGRVRRLTELITRVDSLPIKDGFALD
jgi:hypothetical protein